MGHRIYILLNLGFTCEVRKPVIQHNTFANVRSALIINIPSLLQQCCLSTNPVYKSCMQLFLQGFCAESPNTSQGLSLDVTTLCAPRRQEKPDCIPELQFPGSTIPSQPPGPVIGIFDNFEAILEEDARVEKERSAVHDSGISS